MAKITNFFIFLSHRAIRFMMRFIVKLDRLDPRGRVAYTCLVGEGIEIGALHKPISCDWRKVRVRYVDWKSRDEINNEYSEFSASDFMPIDRIDNGETLATFNDVSLDFVISSHMIEHVENPIATLDNWFRVLRPNGILYLVVPDMRFSFDRQRKSTDFAHLLRDHDEGPLASRQAHFIEWAEHVEHCRSEHVLERARQLESQHYRIHFHVWSPTTFLAFLIDYRVRCPSFEVLHLEQNGDEFIVLLKKQAKK